LLALIKLFCIILGIFYLKNSIKKIKNPYLFAIVLKEYSMPEKLVLRVIAPILIVVEMLLSLLLLSNFSMMSILLVGTGLQAFYISLIFKNMNKSFSNVCNCFPLQVPQKATTKKLLQNLFLFVFFVLIYGLSIRM